MIKWGISCTYDASSFFTTLLQILWIFKVKVVCRKFRQTTQYVALEGKTQSKVVKYYNLDVIISVGNRENYSKGYMLPFPAATAFVSSCHRIRLLQPPQPSHSAIAFDSSSHRIRFLWSSDSTPSAIAFDSFS